MIPQLDDWHSSEHSVLADNQLTVLQSVNITLDQEQIRARLDRKEPRTRHVDAMGIVEVLDGCTSRRFKLTQKWVKLKSA